ncbi:MAG: TIGR00730 family Rossman fold protein [Alphaproteobacteria bacterium]|nr:TIGR00730 family Rossman fold protein [Alphaproteobacteria bacterium]
MPGILSVTVYCGSSSDVDPTYLDLARRLGQAIARRKWRTVYGGGHVGLMGQVAGSAHEAGGKVLGVMPRFLRNVEGVLDQVEHRFVDTMHERKQILFDEADAFVVLPGGIGTLEEAIETLSWAKLSLHRKPMAFLSENGYWTPFFELIDHVIEGGFAPPSFRDLLADAKSPEDSLDALVARAIVLD